MIRPSTTGPRSLIRTTTALPFLRFVTLTNVPSGSAGVGGREIAHIVGFTAGSLFALEIVSVPGRGAYLVGL